MPISWRLSCAIFVFFCIGIKHLMLLQRERLSLLGGDGSNRVALKPIIHFHTWRVGNALNYSLFGECTVIRI